MLNVNTSTDTGSAELVNELVDYELGELEPERVFALFSRLVRTGLAWQLQGHYGRTAQALIDTGLLEPDGTLTIHAHNELAMLLDREADGV